MTARTTVTETAMIDSEYQEIPMIQSETIYKGSTVIIDSNGKAFTNDGTTNTLSAGDRFAGIAHETVTSGASGTTYVNVEYKGRHILTFTDTLTQANLGAKVYVNNTSDDGAVTITADSGVDVYIGNITQFISASTAYVDISKCSFKEIAA